MKNIHSTKKIKEIIGELDEAIYNDESSEVVYLIELADKLYGESIPKINECYELALENGNTIIRYARIIKDILEKYLDTNSIIGFDFNKLNPKDDQLKDLILESINYYNINNKDIACKKIWDAFERMKSHYYGEDGINTDKSKSSNKLIDLVSQGDENYKNLLNVEFQKLTDIGNKYRIRHSEKDKININNDLWYEYFFMSCASLINLCLHFLEGENSYEI